MRALVNIDLGGYGRSFAFESAVELSAENREEIFAAVRNALVCWEEDRRKKRFVEILAMGRIPIDDWYWNHDPDLRECIRLGYMIERNKYYETTSKGFILLRLEK